MEAPRSELLLPSFWIDFLLLPERLEEHLSDLQQGALTFPSAQELIIAFLDQATFIQKIPTAGGSGNIASLVDQDSPTFLNNGATSRSPVAAGAPLALSKSAGRTAELLAERAARVATFVGLSLPDIETLIPSQKHQLTLLRALLEHDPDRSLLHLCALHRWMLRNALDSHPVGSAAPNFGSFAPKDKLLSRKEAAEVQENGDRSLGSSLEAELAASESFRGASGGSLTLVIPQDSPEQAENGLPEDEVGSLQFLERILERAGDFEEQRAGAEPAQGYGVRVRRSGESGATREGVGGEAPDAEEMDLRGASGGVLIQASQEEVERSQETASEAHAVKFATQESSRGAMEPGRRSRGNTLPAQLRSLILFDVAQVHFMRGRVTKALDLFKLCASTVSTSSPPAGAQMLHIQEGGKKRKHMTISNQANGSNAEAGDGSTPHVRAHVLVGAGDEEACTSRGTDTEGSREKAEKNTAPQPLEMEMTERVPTDRLAGFITACHMLLGTVPKSEAMPLEGDASLPPSLGIAAVRCELHRRCLLEAGSSGRVEGAAHEGRETPRQTRRGLKRKWFSSERGLLEGIRKESGASLDLHKSGAHVVNFPCQRITGMGSRGGGAQAEEEAEQGRDGASKEREPKQEQEQEQEQEEEEEELLKEVLLHMHTHLLTNEYCSSLEEDPCLSLGLRRKIMAVNIARELLQGQPVEKFWRVREWHNADNAVSFLFSLIHLLVSSCESKGEQQQQQQQCVECSSVPLLQKAFGPGAPWGGPDEAAQRLHGQPHARSRAPAGRPLFPPTAVRGGSHALVAHLRDFVVYACSVIGTPQCLKLAAMHDGLIGDPVSCDTMAAGGEPAALLRRPGAGGGGGGGGGGTPVLSEEQRSGSQSGSASDVCALSWRVVQSGPFGELEALLHSAEAIARSLSQGASPAPSASAPGAVLSSEAGPELELPRQPQGACGLGPNHEGGDMALDVDQIAVAEREPLSKPHGRRGDALHGEEVAEGRVGSKQADLVQSLKSKAGDLIMALGSFPGSSVSTSLFSKAGSGAETALWQQQQRQQLDRFIGPLEAAMEMCQVAQALAADDWDLKAMLWLLERLKALFRGQPAMATAVGEKPSEHSREAFPRAPASGLFGGNAVTLELVMVKLVDHEMWGHVDEVCRAVAAHAPHMAHDSHGRGMGGATHRPLEEHKCMEGRRVENAETALEGGGDVPVDGGRDDTGLSREKDMEVEAGVDADVEQQQQRGSIGEGDVREGEGVRGDDGTPERELASELLACEQRHGAHGDERREEGEVAAGRSREQQHGRRVRKVVQVAEALQEMMSMCCALERAAAQHAFGHDVACLSTSLQSHFDDFLSLLAGTGGSAPADGGRAGHVLAGAAPLEAGEVGVVELRRVQEGRSSPVKARQRDSPTGLLQEEEACGHAKKAHAGGSQTLGAPGGSARGSHGSKKKRPRRHEREPEEAARVWSSSDHCSRGLRSSDTAPGRGARGSSGREDSESRGLEAGPARRAQAPSSPPATSAAAAFEPPKTMPALPQPGARGVPILPHLSNLTILTRLASFTAGWLHRCHAEKHATWPVDVDRYGVLAGVTAGGAAGLPVQAAAHWVPPMSLECGRDLLRMLLQLAAVQWVPAAGDTGHRWLQGLGDLAFEEEAYTEALQLYLRAGAVHSDDYTRQSAAMSRHVFTPWVVQRMTSALRAVGAPLQAALLCQALPAPDHDLAYRILQSSPFIGSDDAAAYFDCIWELPILELLVHMHAQAGDEERVAGLIALVHQPGLNAHNPPAVRQAHVQAVEQRLLQRLAGELLLPLPQ
eukprot:jgi/Mesen1/3880/ME000208S02890